MALDSTYLNVSDESGDASLMHVATDRSIGATTIEVDTVSGVPAKFIATQGTLLASGFIDPSDKCDFYGHVDGANLEIDGFCPGNSDTGSTEGQVVIIKPNTAWADLVADFIQSVIAGSASISSINLSNPYKFSVYRSAAQNDGGATPAIVVFDTKLFDTGNNFSTSTGKFTAPIDGFYQFNAGVWRSAATGGSAYLYKNDVLAFTGSFGDSGSTENKLHIVAPPPMQLTAGDTIDIRAGGEATVRALDTTLSSCYFGGHLISKN